MIEFETMTRKWGNSIGITIPQEIVKKEKLKNEQKIRILVVKQTNVLKESFGSAKTKQSTERLMKEIDEELYND